MGNQHAAARGAPELLLWSSTTPQAQPASLRVQELQRMQTANLVSDIGRDWLGFQRIAAQHALEPSPPWFQTRPHERACVRKLQRMHIIRSQVRPVSYCLASLSSALTLRRAHDCGSPCSFVAHEDLPACCCSWICSGSWLAWLACCVTQYSTSLLSTVLAGSFHAFAGQNQKTCCPEPAGSWHMGVRILRLARLPGVCPPRHCIFICPPLLRCLNVLIPSTWFSVILAACRLLPVALHACVPQAPAAPHGRLAQRPPACCSGPYALPVRSLPSDLSRLSGPPCGGCAEVRFTSLGTLAVSVS